MGKKSLDLDSISFGSRVEAVEHFKALLRRYAPGDRVSDTDAVELTALLKRHPDYVGKIGSGIDHFGVVAAEYGTQCFGIKRLDGSEDRFSYLACIKN